MAGQQQQQQQQPPSSAPSTAMVSYDGPGTSQVDTSTLDRAHAHMQMVRWQKRLKNMLKDGFADGHPMVINARATIEACEKRYLELLDESDDDDDDDDDGGGGGGGGLLMNGEA